MARRREYGDGSLYQRKSDGRWTGAFVLPDGSRKVVYGDTRAEAKKKLEEAKKAAAQGQLLPVSRQRLADYLDYWLSIHKIELKPTVAYNYAANIRKWIVPALGSVYLQKLSTIQIQKFVSSLTEHLMPRTVKDVYVVLHQALEDAVEWKLLLTNPCKGVRLPRVERANTQALTAEQAQTLLKALAGHELEALVSLALATGMRRGELLGLKWSDIDFERSRLTVQRNLIYTPEFGFQEVEPKSDAGRRSLFIAQFALDVLREHRKRQIEMRLQAERWQERNLVFCKTPPCRGIPGDYYQFSVMERRFKVALQKLGLTVIHFHELRHSTASLLISQGVPLKVVQEILGHSSIKITSDIYGHVLPGMQEAAMEGLNSLLSGGKKESKRG